MERVLLLAAAELLELQPFRLGASVLGGVIVVLFALSAFERDHGADILGHIFPLPNNCTTVSRDRDSNPGPHPYHGCALPAELSRRYEYLTALMQVSRCDYCRTNSIRLSPQQLLAL